MVREGGELAYGNMARRASSAAPRSTRTVVGADQVLVGLNRTRRLYNRRIRELLGIEGPLPVAGDRLVCLRNDRAKGLINGGLWRVEALGGRCARTSSA